LDGEFPGRYHLEISAVLIISTGSCAQIP
jgi:hypothetical protein